MTDQILINGLQLMGKHGVYDYEKERAQPFIVDLAVSIDLKQAGESDRMKDSLSYSVFVDIATQVIQGEHHNLIEALAERIAAKILESEPVTEVEVTVRKPRAPVNGVVEDVGVRITRS